MSDPDANELLHLKPQLVKHAPNLPVDALTEDNSHPGHSDRLHLLHPRAFAVQHDAGQELRRERRFPRAIERDFVFLFDLVARMGQALREIAVVGQDEEAFRLRVEPADIEKTGKLRRQEVENRIPCVRIDPGGNEAGRFVQDDVEMAFAADQLSANLHVIAFRRLRAEVGDDAAVDRDPPLGD